MPAADNVFRGSSPHRLGHVCRVGLPIGCAGAHILMLGAYTKYNPGSAQYEWLRADLEAFSRGRTPWLIATFHATWYNTYEAGFLPTLVLDLQTTCVV